MGVVRRVVVAAAVLPVMGAVLLAGEVLVAQRGIRLKEPAPAPADVHAGPPGAGAPLVVWLGDSTAAGMGASGPAAALPRQVADLLGQPVRLTVLAHSGDTIADVLRVQVPVLLTLAPDAVYVSVGANDVTHLTRRPTFRREYTRMLALLPPSVHQVVLLGVPDLGAPRIPEPLRAVAAWRGRALDRDVRHLAARTHAVYVDIAGRAGPSFRHDPRRYLAADRYHPDDAGYRLWAGAVAEAVRAVRLAASPG